MLAFQLSDTECWLTPVPEREAFGELVALLATATEPVTLPVEVGSKLTLKLAVWPAASVRGMLGPLTLKPVPDAVAVEIVTLALPVFVATMGSVLELPTVTLPKATLDGLRLSVAEVDEAVRTKALESACHAPLTVWVI